MAKRVTLKGHEQRKWSANAPYLLSAEGRPAREASEGERRAIIELTRHAQVKGTSARARAPGGNTYVEVFVERTRTPQGGVKKIVRFEVDGMSITDTRAVMRAEILARHGECQLIRTNGKYLTTIRDPNSVRPTAKDALRTAPKPEHCVCASWGAPHPGRHHRVCVQNEKAPPEERGDIDFEGSTLRASEEDIRIIETAQQRGAAPAALPAPAVAAAPPAPPPPPAPPEPDFYEPKDCPNGCAAWERTDGREKGDGHHPLCQHAAAWDSRGGERYMLVDFARREVLREALPEEIAEGNAQREKTGAGIITITGQQYLVVPESELEDEGDERDTEPPLALTPESATSTVPEDDGAPVNIEETP